MSGLNLLNTPGSIGIAPLPAIKETGFGLTAASAMVSGLYNTPVTGQQILVGNVKKKNNALIKEKTGLDIFQHTGMDKKYTNPNAEGRVAMYEEASPLMAEIIIRGRKENPEGWKDILTDAEIEAQAKEKVNFAEQVAADIAQRNPSGFSRVSGQFIGGMGGASLDLPNLVTLPISAPRMAGATAARQILMTAASEAAVQASIQAMQIPGMKKWQEKLGKKYGIKEAAIDVGFAATGGAAIRGLVETGALAIEKALSRYGDKDPRADNPSHVIDEIEKNIPRAHVETKDALKQLSREAYIAEQSPIPIKTSKEAKAHRDATQNVIDSIETYKKPSTNIPGVSAEVQIQPAPIRAVQDEAHIIMRAQNQIPGAIDAKNRLLEAQQKAKALFDEAWSKWEAQNGTEKPPLFDDNAYRLSEYREPVTKSPIETKEADRIAARQANFASLVKSDPDMMVTLDDGTQVKMADYAKMMKEDQKVLEALTTCRLE